MSILSAFSYILSHKETEKQLEEDIDMSLQDLDPRTGVERIHEHLTGTQHRLQQYLDRLYIVRQETAEQIAESELIIRSLQLSIDNLSNPPATQNEYKHTELSVTTGTDVKEDEHHE